MPVTLEEPVNTAGGGDSPFISPGGNTLYFFFTPRREHSRPSLFFRRLAKK